MFLNLFYYFIDKKRKCVEDEKYESRVEKSQKTHSSQISIINKQKLNLNLKLKIIIFVFKLN